MDDFRHDPFEPAFPRADAPAPLPVPAAAAPRPSAIHRLGGSLFGLAKTLMSAAIYATVIVTFGFQVARVDGQSMAPTLADQDRLIVNKLGYQLPHHAPRVGDIVMLLYPEDPKQSYVKRVMAGPGDSIRSVEGRVFRNDVALPDDFIPEEFRSHDTWGPEIVPPAHYFVMGDHRSNSSDSRLWSMHFVPEKYILGRVQLRWWPLSKARIFAPWSDGGQDAIR